MKTLIIEGGAMRTVYAAGALTAMSELGMDQNYFDLLLGTSAGACNGSYFLAGQSQLFWDIWGNTLLQPDFINIRNILSKKPVVNIDKLEYIMRDKHPVDVDKVIASPTKFYVVATNCHNGQAEYFINDQKHSFFEVLKASSALPLLYNKTISLNNQAFIDGALADPLPVQKALDLGATDIIAILTRHEGYRKNKAISENIASSFLKKYPKVKETMVKRHLQYNKSLDLLYSEHPNVKITVIRPRYNLKISRITNDPRRIRPAFRVGYYDAMRLFGKNKNIKAEDESQFHLSYPGEDMPV